MPITKENLDTTALAGCGHPNCTHSTHTFWIHCSCHVEAGIEASYTYDTGVIKVICRSCKQLVVEIAVESDRSRAARIYDNVKDPVCVCWNCGWEGPESKLGCDLGAIPDLSERISPGEEVPVGECPVCGSLCHIKTDE